jgi:phage gpG-like protein
VSGAVNVQFEVLGDEQVWASFVGIEERAGDMREPLEASGHTLEDLAARQFESQGAYASGGWAPLSPKYAAAKLAFWGPRPILVASGKLRRILTEHGIREVTRDTLIYGTFDDVAGWHQHGTENMPARPIIVVGPVEREEIDGHFRAWMASVIDGGARYLARDVRGRFR